MREWWKNKDYLGVEGEYIVDENTTQEQLISLIKSSWPVSGAKIIISKPSIGLAADFCLPLLIN